TPPSARASVPITATLRRAAGGPTVDFAATTDTSGFFTITTSLPPDDYSWTVKNPQMLAGAGSSTWAGSLNALEVGTLRAGDANNDNCVSSIDFTILKASFGKALGQPGYDARADFNGDDTVSSGDFTLLKGNFGLCGAALPSTRTQWQRLAGSGIDYR